MGLDMYAYVVDAKAIGESTVDFDLPEAKAELAYWRKHPDLHGFMEQLYREKGGTDRQFNCASVRLTEEDLKKLEDAIRAGQLPHTEGFFFGSSSWQEWPPTDLKFISDALWAIKNGLAVVYTSWW